MRLFDTHCHLDDERFNEDREQLIQALPEQGLVYCVTVGSDLDSSERAIALAGRGEFLGFCIRCRSIDGSVFGFVQRRAPFGVVAAHRPGRRGWFICRTYAMRRV